MNIEDMLAAHGIGASSGSGDAITFGGLKPEEYLQKTKHVIVSEVIPTTGLYDGVEWFQPSTRNFKKYFSGEFHNIDSGSNGGLTFEDTTSYIELTVASTEVPIGISTFTQGDLLFASKGRTVLTRGLHYDVSADYTKIFSLEGEWEVGSIFTFRVVKSIPSTDTLTTAYLENTYTATATISTGIPINIPEFNPDLDLLFVYQDNLKLYRDVQWTLNSLDKTIDLINYGLNAGQTLRFEVWKRIRAGIDGAALDGTLLINQSVLNDALGPDIKIGSLSEIGDLSVTEAIKKDRGELARINLLVDSLPTASETYRGEKVMLKGKDGISEVSELTITNTPTASGNVTVTLDGVATNIAVTIGLAEVANLQVTAPPITSGNVVVTLDGNSTQIPVTTGISEVVSLTINAAPTVAGNVTVSLDDGTGTLIDYTFTLDPAVDTTAAAVADKIRAGTFTGWSTDTANTGTTTVTFTASGVGTKSDGSYTDTGATGATGTITVTTQGANADTINTVASKIRSTPFTGWTTGGSADTVTFTAIEVGTKTDAVYSDNGTGSTATMNTTTQGVNADSINTVAAKIRGTTYDGWTTSGTDAIVYFTSNTTISRTDSTYTDNATGTTGTMLTKTQGEVATEDRLYICKRLADGTYKWGELNLV